MRTFGFVKPFLRVALAASFLAAFLPNAAQAQAASPRRITHAIDDTALVTLKGNTPPGAKAKNDRGPVSASLPMPDLTLVLSRSPEQQAAFEAFVASQYDQTSPNYHQWLVPTEIGRRFGPSQGDLASISNWLTGQGFKIIEIAPDGMTIRFSGTARMAERAFHTAIHNLSVNGVSHIGNMSDPQIPAALAPVVIGVKALHNFLPRPTLHAGNKVVFNREMGKWQRIVNTAAAGPSQADAANAVAGSSSHPLFGINVPASGNNSAYLEEDVAPYDFATIYNVQPVWTAGITGSGQTIAIAGTSNIDLSDVTTFRSTFGLPAGSTPTEIDTNGLATECTSTTASSICGISDLEENTIDVEWSGAVATGAQIALVVTGQNSAGTIDSIYDSAKYVVENLTGKILNVSYGGCELGQGTAGNVAYYDLWQTAAAEGIAVFVAAGDSGSPGCDQAGDQIYGNPYSAQYGLAVNGIASTPYNTAVGGTDFSWCKPTINGSGNVVGCPMSSTSQGTPAYWNTSNNGTTGASAKGYVPETPWNDTCMNPILASYLESVASYLGTPAPTTNAEGACNFVQNNWLAIYNTYGSILAPYVDTAGGSGGASGCVVNNGQDVSSCSSSTTSTGSQFGSIPLHNDGWPKPSWQTGVPGIPGDGVRDIPDVSFFAGDGSLESAYLVCISAIGSCTYSDTSENTAEEFGGTSFGSPAMAGVMALINQKTGAAQGSPNAQLYELGARQTYSECKAESVTTSSSCYFNDIDEGTNAMPCDLGAPIGGAVFSDGVWFVYPQAPEYAGTVSPNCTALIGRDQVGTLTNSTGTAYNAATGFDLATGLGSLNVANVVNAWISTAGTATATMDVHLSATSLPANTPLTVTVTMTGSGSLGTPTGTISLGGGGYSTTATLSSGAATITIPANSLSPGTDTLTVTYGGDSNYASITQTETVTVSVVTPMVTVTALTPDNVANPLTVSVVVSGPSGASTPTGTVSLSGGGYNSGAVMLSTSGAATFAIPAHTLTVGSDVLTATYSGNSNYGGATGSFTVMIVNTAVVTPSITVTPALSSVDTGQSLGVTVKISGSSGTPTGAVTLTAGSYTSSAVTLDGSGTASFTVPSNSLTPGTATLTATYGGNAVYANGSGTGTVTVTQSSYSLSATTPASVAIGGTTTSTVTVTSSTGYNGTVTLTCTATSGPSNAAFPPTCSANSTVTMTNGVASGTATLTISTTSAQAMLHSPDSGKTRGRTWIGASGAALAFLVFFGIPAHRRSWRSLMGILVLLITLGGMSACGGGGGGGGSSGTTLGTYTITVSGQGNDPSGTTATTTFNVVVN